MEKDNGQKVLEELGLKLGDNVYIEAHDTSYKFYLKKEGGLIGGELFGNCSVPKITSLEGVIKDYTVLTGYVSLCIRTNDNKLVYISQVGGSPQ